MKFYDVVKKTGNGYSDDSLSYINIDEDQNLIL